VKKYRIIKIIFTGISVLISAGGFQLAANTRAYALTQDGRFYFTPQSRNLLSGCESTINIQISTGSNYSNAANVIINYNPNEISILDSDPYTSGTQILPGSAYSNYADNVVDSENGKIRLTGFSVGSNLSGTKTFGIIKFKSLPGVLQTSLKLQFTNVGDTLDSNIAETKSGNDILGSVGSSTYTFSEGNCYGDVTSPTITPIHPKNYEINISQDSGVEVEICDSDSGVNIDSIRIIIDGASYSKKDINNFFHTGDSSCYSIRLIPKSKFKENTPVLVIFKASDFSGNEALKTIIFNITPETAECLIQLDEKLQELYTCRNELSTCLANKCDLSQLPQTGERKSLSEQLGFPELFSILALIILILHPFWRNPESKDTLNKLIPRNMPIRIVIFVIGFALSILGAIYEISVLSTITVVLYIGTMLLLILKNKPN
jgi:hypothetical protein